MKRILFVILLLGACTAPEKTKELLEMEGFEQIEITGYRIWGCSQDDELHTGFKAWKNGKTRSGVVCAGLFFKGATIRYD